MVAQLAPMAIVVSVVLVTAWMFVLPLLHRSDYDDRADTHGSARIAARQRGKYGAVHVLDPFGVTGL